MRHVFPTLFAPKTQAVLSTLPAPVCATLPARIFVLMSAFIENIALFWYMKALSISIRVIMVTLYNDIGVVSSIYIKNS